MLLRTYIAAPRVYTYRLLEFSPAIRVNPIVRSRTRVLWRCESSLKHAVVNPQRRGWYAGCEKLIHYGQRDTLLERMRRRIHLEHGLLFGLALTLTGVGVLLAVFVRWARAGFGPLGDEYPTALGITLVGLGVQTIFGSFFLSLMTMRSKREDTPAPQVVVEDRATERV